MNKPTSDWLVLIRSFVAGFDSTPDTDFHEEMGLKNQRGAFALVNSKKSTALDDS